MLIVVDTLLNKKKIGVEITKCLFEFFQRADYKSLDRQLRSYSLHKCVMHVNEYRKYSYITKV